MRARKRWALIVLLVWMPAYIAGAWWLLALAYDRWGRPPMLAEAVIYLVLGILWAVPFRRTFNGIGKEGE